MESSVITTILHRPYVFAFLISFLVIGLLNRGMGRTLLFLALGFSIAWISEFSSIRNGFPYGMYHYVYENMKGELIIGGVPVWDSLSYSFLAYASYELVSYFFKNPKHVPLIGAFFMMLMDMAVDPLAVRGDRWFLGHVFYYPNGGLYFGVPLTNFAGWLLVALLILYTYDFIEKKCFKEPSPQRFPLLGPLFYWGILAFNLAITFSIGENVIGFSSLMLHSFPTMAFFQRKNKLG